MKSLFVRIFLSYWVAQALFLVLAMVTMLAMRSSNEIAAISSQQPKFLAEAVQAYQAGGENAAWRYLRGLHESEHVRLYVFDDQGRDLLGRKPPEWVAAAMQGRKRTADSIWGRIGPMQLLRYSAAQADGRSYTLITELPEQRALFGPHGVPGLALLIAILSSGLVCYALAGYLTSPIVRLRAATRKLASGDLTARAGTSQSRRSDELAGLVRDFDGMAERLETLVNAQKRLLTDISHELRSPLARLTVALELARQRSGSDSQSALDRIDRETSRLNELIQRLLTIARLEAGDVSVKKSAVNLGDLIREIARDADFEAQARNCQVAVAIQDECIVPGNAGLLHSAIENVVRNAIRYTQEGTAVEVRLETGDAGGIPEAVVRVTDSGPGIPEESLQRVFEPFYRIDDARGRQTGGVGLGLAITDRAVRLHQGAVRAANRPQGGLMLEIRIPLDGTSTRQSPLRLVEVPTTTE